MRSVTASGGQPAHAAAWEDDACNALTGAFFRNTRQTLNTAWLRPRYEGYMTLQDRAGDIVHACLCGEHELCVVLKGWTCKMTFEMDVYRIR